MRTSEATARFRCFGDEARLRWFGHVQRRDGAHRCRRMLRFELPSRILPGRPKGRYMDALRENVKSVGEVEHGFRWQGCIDRLRREKGGCLFRYKSFNKMDMHTVDKLS